MSKNVYLAYSYPLLYKRLVEHAALDLGVINLVESRDQADMIIYLQPRQWEKDARDSLRSFRPRDFRRTYVYSQTDDPFPWAPGMYVSLPAARASNAFTGGFYIAEHHHEPGGLAEHIEAAKDTKPDRLWGFMGTLENHPVRQRLRGLSDDRGFVLDTQLWSDTIRWKWRSRRTESQTAFADYAHALGRSSFVLCPRGRGPSSFRIFEALWAGRCPVIISDEWLPPAFVDWESCAIRIPEAEVEHLPRLLRGYEAEAETLGRNARLVWERFFSPERQLNTIIGACLAILDSSPPRAAVLTRAVMRPHNVRIGLRKAKVMATGKG